MGHNFFLGGGRQEPAVLKKGAGQRSMCDLNTFFFSVLLSMKIFRTESNLDGYFHTLFTMNFEPKVLLHWKVILYLFS